MRLFDKPVNMNDRDTVANTAAVFTTIQIEVVRCVEVKSIETSLSDQVNSTFPTSIDSKRSIRFRIFFSFLLVSIGILCLLIVALGWSWTTTDQESSEEGQSNFFSVIEQSLENSSIDYQQQVSQRESNSSSIASSRGNQSCSSEILIDNVRLVFHRCSTCPVHNNSIIHRLIFNETLLDQPLIVEIDSDNRSRLNVEICSTTSPISENDQLQLDSSSEQTNSFPLEMLPLGNQLIFSFPSLKSADEKH